MRNLCTRLQRGLIANGKPRAALGVLFLFGCCCGVPLLLRASSSRGEASVPAVASVGGNSALSASTPNSIHVSPSFWKSLSESLECDPLFHPADLSLTARDPFALDDDQFPSPVLFATDRFDEAAAKPVVIQQTAAPGLELRSTMIGRTRRVALINGRLYHPGQDVIANSQRYRLASIESQRVVLTAGDQDFVLAMPRPSLRDALIQDDVANVAAPLQP